MFIDPEIYHDDTIGKDLEEISLGLFERTEYGTWVLTQFWDADLLAEMLGVAGGFPLNRTLCANQGMDNFGSPVQMKLRCLPHDKVVSHSSIWSLRPFGCLNRHHPRIVAGHTWVA